MTFILHLLPFLAKWSVEELSSVMHMPTAAIRRKIAFWQSHGVLKEETTDTFLLVEEHKGRSHEVVIVEEDETESAMASASDQREEEFQVRASVKNSTWLQKEGHAYFNCWKSHYLFYNDIHLQFVSKIVVF